MYDYPSYVPQGWQCPVCKRVYAPTESMCIFCGNQDVTTMTKLEINTQTGTSPAGWVVKEEKRG